MIGVIRHFTRRMFSPRYLLVTNTVSSGLLLALGDVLQQCNERRIARKKNVLLKVNAASGTVGNIGSDNVGTPQPAFNWTRTGRMLTIGILLGPLNHYWYLGLDRFLPGIKGKTIAKKIILDEIIASPVMTTIFFVGMGLLEGKTWAESVNVLKKKFLTVYMIDWCFWPTCQAINFAFVPLHLRVVYVNCVDICVWPPVQAVNFFFVPPNLRVIYVNGFILLWDVFLSFINHN